MSDSEKKISSVQQVTRNYILKNLLALPFFEKHIDKELLKESKGSKIHFNIPNYWDLVIDVKETVIEVKADGVIGEMNKNFSSPRSVITEIKDKLRVRGLH